MNKVITDKLGLGLDELIKIPVYTLISLGYKTTQSCQGHSDWGLPYPWIEIDGDYNSFNTFIQIYKLEHNCKLAIKIYEKPYFRLVGGNYTKYDLKGQAFKRAYAKNWTRPDEEMNVLIQGLSNDQKDMQSFCDWLYIRRSASITVFA